MVETEQGEASEAPKESDEGPHRVDTDQAVVEMEQREEIQYPQELEVGPQLGGTE